VAPTDTRCHRAGPATRRCSDGTRTAWSCVEVPQSSGRPSLSTESVH
jgi:hypothetical protein